MTSTLYGFDGPFQLLHADVGNLKFLGKSAANPKYSLICVDLFTSKVYVYTMKSRKSIAAKMEIFCKEVERIKKYQKQSCKRTRNLNKIFDLNKKCNVDMFSTAVSVESGKAFTVEQKLTELKERIFRLKALEKNSKVKD